MNKLSMLAAAMLLVIAAAPASAREFKVDGVLVSDTCSTPQGQKYVYDGFYGTVGSPCSWHIGEYWFYGKFGG